MFGALNLVVASLVVATRIQSVSQATTLIKEFVESLQVRDNGFVNYIGQT
jgi:hypothetical protein